MYFYRPDENKYIYIKTNMSKTSDDITENTEKEQESDVPDENDENDEVNDDLEFIYNFGLDWILELNEFNL